MDVLTNVYFDTVNPLADYSRLIRLDVLFSIVFHLIVYLLIFYYGYNAIYLFKKFISRKRMIYTSIIVLFILCFGYIGRLMRSKSIYNYFILKHYTKQEAVEKTYQVMNNGYFTYYFLG